MAKPKYEKWIAFSKQETHYATWGEGYRQDQPGEYLHRFDPYATVWIEVESKTKGERGADPANDSILRNFDQAGKVYWLSDGRVRVEVLSVCEEMAWSKREAVVRVTLGEGLVYSIWLLSGFPVFDEEE